MRLHSPIVQLTNFAVTLRVAMTKRSQGSPLEVLLFNFHCLNSVAGIEHGVTECSGMGLQPNGQAYLKSYARIGFS